MSTITKDKHMKRLKESSLWLFLLFYPTSLLRVTYYATMELILEALTLVGYPFMRLVKKRKGIFGFWIPFRRLLMNSLLTELITLGTIIDIKRHVSKIYLNFMNYDDLAHLRGPKSLSAFVMVRALDRRIKRICNAAREDYDIYIMSDHGQVDSVTFESINDMELAEFIERCAHVPSFGVPTPSEGRLTMWSIAVKRFMWLIEGFSAPARWLGNAVSKSMLKVLRPAEKNIGDEEKAQIFVEDSCSLANVYFMDSKERMELKEVEAKYPKLVEKLIHNKGIGIIMAKSGTGFTLIGKGGKVEVSPKTVRFEGKHFLQGYGDEWLLINQLREYDTTRFIGDLVLFGQFENGVATSFTDHVGSHGGIGGDMQYPFFMTNKKIDLSKVKNAKELHRIFAEYH